MSYTPTNWSTGDTITASAMNKIENGIANAGGVLIVHSVNDVLDKTVQEIYDAMNSGIPVFISWTYGSFETDYESNTYFALVVKIYTYNDKDLIRVCASYATYEGSMSGSEVTFPFTPAIALFSASSASAYPVYYRTISAAASQVAPK